MKWMCVSANAGAMLGLPSATRGAPEKRPGS